MIDEDHSRQRKLHFVLGTGRCGSTLVHEILCQHEDVAFISNLEDRVSLLGAAARMNGPAYRALPPSFTTKGRVRFAPSEAYRLLERKVSPVLAMSSRDLVESDALPWLRRRLQIFFAEHQERQRAPVFLHKFTGWPRARFLQEIFPDARFVHVIRDGRAVANSWVQMPWWLGFRGPDHWHWGPLSPSDEKEWESSARSFVVLAGIAWKLLIDAAIAAQAEIPTDQWLDVRYEELLRDPETTVGRIVEFLGLRWSAAFRKRLALYSFESDRADAFRRDLDECSLVRLDALLGPSLRRLGYDLSDPR